jgi:hypothetical protein
MLAVFQPSSEYILSREMLSVGRINHFHDVIRSLIIQPLDGIVRLSRPIRVKQAAIRNCAAKTVPPLC